MTDKAKLFELLEAFLAEKVPAGPGGDYMAQATDEHMSALYSIIFGIIGLKFEGDCDGDTPVHVDLTDMSKEIPFCHLYMPIPHFFGYHGDERRVLLSNACT